jgi:Phenylalanyl-tRNA synthetase alpha subunit
MQDLDLEKIKVEAKGEIENAGDLAGLVLIGKKYLDKDGVLGEFFKSLGKLSKEERAEAGVKANEIKQYLAAVFEAKSGELEAKNIEQSGQNFLIPPCRALRRPWDICIRSP